MSIAHPDNFVLMVMGGGFIIMGIVMFLWGRQEKKSYYDSLCTRSDLRKFLERSPSGLSIVR